MELDSAGEAAALPPKQEPCRRRSRFAGRLELVHSDRVEDGGQDGGSRSRLPRVLTAWERSPSAGARAGSSLRGRRSRQEGLAEAVSLPLMASEPEPLGFRAAVVARYAALACGDVDRAFAGVAYDIAPAG